MTGTRTVPNFRLNNPKNYLGYTIAVAVASEQDTDVATLMETTHDGKRISRDVAGSRAGAKELDLISITSNSAEVTDLGQRVVAVGRTEHESKTAALDALRSLFGKSKRFVDALPGWESVTQGVLLNHPGIYRLLTLLQQIHADRDDSSAVSLPVLIQEIHHRDPNFAKECFIPSEKWDSLEEIEWKPSSSDETPQELWEKPLYRPSVVHQFKSMLWHAGILTTRGRTRASLEFSSDVDPFMWGLTETFLENSTTLSWDTPGDTDQPDIEEQVRDAKPPDRTETKTSRIIRNTDLVKALKTKYEYRCQVCGDRRQRSEDQYYAEGHHLYPLGEGGPDIQENILIVCPTCHADFDYGMLTVDTDTLEISHRYDMAIDGETLRVKDTHTVGESYLTYHNQEIAE